MSERNIITIGYYKGDMDFSVNCSIADLSYDDMKELRNITFVAIGVAHQMWSKVMEEKNPPSASLTNPSVGEDNE